MDEESNIKQAKPKQGLETGGLISGSEAAKARVAKAYEKDLSGKNGALPRFEALQELIGKQLEEFANNMTFASGDGTQIFGTGGTFAVRSARRGGKGGVPVDQAQIARKFPWDIAYDSVSEQYVMYRPLIMKGRTDVEGVVPVTNTPFTPEANAWLVLEIDAIPVTAATVVLVTNTDWEGEAEYPSAYKFDTVTPWAFERARIPLWRFYDVDGSDAGGRFVLGEDLYGEKLVKDGPLLLGYTIVEVPGENVVRTAPELY